MRDKGGCKGEGGEGDYFLEDLVRLGFLLLVLPPSEQDILPSSAHSNPLIPDSKAGRQGDPMLVPALSVVFSEVPPTAIV